MTRPLRYPIVIALVLGAVTLAGCGTSSDQALRTTLAALSVPVPKSAPSSVTSEPKCPGMTASLRPPATLPAPGAMPRGSFMAAIQRRGYLLAGVNAGLLNFGYLNPATGQIEGFEIDLVSELAKAIFGTAKGHVRLVALTVKQRIPFVQQGKVDVVVDAVTITCSRKKQVDFSTVYYDAQQRVLVPSSSAATSIADFINQPVCASSGSTPIVVMSGLPAPPKPLGMPQAIDCLVGLQEGTVPAISTDDSILLGFKAQDSNTKIIGPSLADVPYGMAISQARPDFVRFVNGVLARLRADGTWRRLYGAWLGHIPGSNPTIPPAQYDG